MTQAPIEEQLRAIADAARGDGELPAKVLHGVRRRRSRGRAVIAASTIGAAGVATVLALAPVTIVHFGTKHETPAPLGQSMSPAATATPTPTRATFSALPVVSQPKDAAEPETMLALIGAGAERLARVDTGTGMVGKWLQDKGSQALVVPGPDSSIVYQPDSAGICYYSWTAIDTRTGATSPAYEELGNPVELAIAQDGTRVAYLHVGRQQRVPDARGGTIAAGCPTAPHDLIVADPSTGATISYPIENYDASLSPAFDPSGTRLAIVWHQHVRILDLNRDDTITDAQPLTADFGEGCTQHRPMWRPGSDTVLVSEECGQHAAIVGYDARTGKETYRHDIADPGIVTFDVDASGKHIVYSLSRFGLGVAEGSVFAVEPGGDRHILDDAYQVIW